MNSIIYFLNIELFIIFYIKEMDTVTCVQILDKVDSNSYRANTIGKI